MAFHPPPVLPLTDGAPAAVASHGEQAQALLSAGMRCIQVRDKALDDDALLAQLDSAVASARRHHGFVLVNDRPDLALLSGAGGVHLGEEDLPLADARRILGPAAVLGRSSHDEASARAAMDDEADYVAFGPIYSTLSKSDARRPAGLERLRRVREAVSIPLVAIGGITLARAAEVFAAGADSVAVIRDLAGAPDVAQRARQWLAGVAGGNLAPRGLVFLTGFMGAGKSAVGERLARRLQRRFVDLDTEIARQEGMTVAEIFRRRGEPAFRACEKRMVATLPAGADAVIALGGGTLMQPENLRAVQDRGPLVWLECSVEDSLARCEMGPQRPLLRLEEAGSLLQQRLPGYEAAQLTVQSTRSPEHLATEIAAWVRARGAAEGSS
jgi:thiamine-phosphate diphosphorylase